MAQRLSARQWIKICTAWGNYSIQKIWQLECFFEYIKGCLSFFSKMFSILTTGNFLWGHWIKLQHEDITMNCFVLLYKIFLFTLETEAFCWIVWSAQGKDCFHGVVVGLEYVDAFICTHGKFWGGFSVHRFFAQVCRFIQFHCRKKNHIISGWKVQTFKKPLFLQAYSSPKPPNTSGDQWHPPIEYHPWPISLQFHCFSSLSPCALSWTTCKTPSGPTYIQGADFQELEETVWESSNLQTYKESFYHSLDPLFLLRKDECSQKWGNQPWIRFLFHNKDPGFPILNYTKPSELTVAVLWDSPFCPDPGASKQHCGRSPCFLQPTHILVFRHFTWKCGVWIIILIFANFCWIVWLSEPFFEALAPHMAFHIDGHLEAVWFRVSKKGTGFLGYPVPFNSIFYRVPGSKVPEKWPPSRVGYPVTRIFLS